VSAGAGAASRTAVWDRRDTPEASAPAAIVIAPGSAVNVVPDPKAELLAPIAWVKSLATPLHAESSSPPSEIVSRRFARTASLGAWFVSGKCWPFVAAYVAVELLQA